MSEIPVDYEVLKEEYHTFLDHYDHQHYDAAAQVYVDLLIQMCNNSQKLADYQQASIAFLLQQTPSDTYFSYRAFVHLLEHLHAMCEEGILFDTRIRAKIY